MSSRRPAHRNSSLAARSGPAREPGPVLLALALLLTSGCGVREQAATSAVVGVEAEFASLRMAAERVDSVQAAVIEDELEYARRSVSRRDFDGAERTARVVATRLRELRVRLEIAERRERLGPETFAPDSIPSPTRGTRGEAGATRETTRRQSR